MSPTMSSTPTARPAVDSEASALRWPWQAARRRRRLPHAVAGALLVVACVVAYAYGAVVLGRRVQVLAVARPVAAGQVLAAEDLVTVTAVRDGRVGVIDAADAPRVVGQAAAVPLLAGTLLTRAHLGPSALPPVGQQVASVALKPGQYPQGLAAGAHVAVYLTPTGAPEGQSSAPAGTPAVAAVVLGVDVAGDGQGATVITLLVGQDDAPRLAATPAEAVVLMQTAVGR